MQKLVKTLSIRARRNGRTFPPIFYAGENGMAEIRAARAWKLPVNSVVQRMIEEDAKCRQDERAHDDREAQLEEESQDLDTESGRPCVYDSTHLFNYGFDICDALYSS
jgi:hypothetical protein